MKEQKTIKTNDETLPVLDKDELPLQDLEEIFSQLKQGRNMLVSLTKKMNLGGVKKHFLIDEKFIDSRDCSDEDKLFMKELFLPLQLEGKEKVYFSNSDLENIFTLEMIDVALKISKEKPFIAEFDEGYVLDLSSDSISVKFHKENPDGFEYDFSLDLNDKKQTFEKIYQEYLSLAMLSLHGYSFNKVKFEDLVNGREKELSQEMQEVQTSGVINVLTEKEQVALLPSELTWLAQNTSFYYPSLLTSILTKIYSHLIENHQDFVEYFVQEKSAKGHFKNHVLVRKDKAGKKHYWIGFYGVKIRDPKTQELLTADWNNETDFFSYVKKTTPETLIKVDDSVKLEDKLI